jgi:hypothetical protein
MATGLFCTFSIFIVALELFTGCALIGWTGDNMVVQREKSPGPYWFAIVLHSLIGIVIPAIFFFAT